MFRFIKSALLAVLVLIAFNSCDKEMSKEIGEDNTQGSQSGTAVFTLDGSPFACSTPLINGDYVIGQALDNTNSVIINVNVTTVGTYIISTGLINGIQFTGQGTFTTTGTQTISLFGTGTPQLAITSLYTPGVNNCSFTVTAVTAIVIPLAEGTLDCTGATTGGVFTQSVPLTGTNTVTIPVNVSSAGSYSITTTANGATFSGSGTLALGNQNIVLSGNGTPTNLGATSFPVSLGPSSCSFSITFLPAPPPAVGTLNCAGATVAGSYSIGTALDGSNTVTIPVNITTAGLYNITTTATNGVTFSGAGVVAAGAQNVVLTGSGTPAAAGAFSFPVTFGASSCNFSVTFASGPANVFRATIDGVVTNFNVNLTSDTTPLFGGYTIAVEGDASATTGEHLDFTVNSLSPITAGTYLQPFGLTFATSRYYDPVSGQGYQPSEANSSPQLSVIVTSVSGNRIVGTFSAQYFDLNGTGTNSKQFTNGVFNVAY